MPATQTAPYAIATSALRAFDSVGKGAALLSKLAEIAKPKVETPKKNAMRLNRVSLLLIWLDRSG